MTRFRWLTNPYVMGIVTLIGVLIGIIGLIYAWSSRATRELTYYTRPVRTSIVRMGQASELKVFHQGREVTADVSAVQIAVWNRGRASIRREHILEPVLIHADPSVSILEVKVLNQTRPVVRFALDTIEISAARVGITWQILEQNDGGVIQMIYAGTPDAKITVTGVVEGQRAIMDTAQIRLRMPWFETTSTFALLIIMGYAIRRYALQRKGLSTKRLDRLLVVFLLLWIPLNVVAVLDSLTVYFGRRGPPFGF